VVTRTRQITGPCVSIAAHTGGPAAELSRALEARGIRTVVTASLRDAVASATGAIAFAPDATPTPDVAAELAGVCARAAHDARPVAMLAAFPPDEDHDTAVARTAALAYLRAHGAIVCADPNTWLEILALVASYGLPAGPRVAVVAPPTSWLGLTATALAAERSASGQRPAPLLRDASAIGPADTALVDRAMISTTTPARVAHARVVPVVGRAEHLVTGAPVALVGLREAIDAATMAGAAAARTAAGLGPDPPGEAAGLGADEARFARQLDQLALRAGDHETKVMLRAWGVRITRQAVATTPSAATRLAKRAGWPVQIKPWSPDAPTERDGCPVETDLRNAPDVRRACVTVIKRAGLSEGAAVIVRETPPDGRTLRARVARIGALGWTVVLDIAGVAGPVAAPAPLRAVDAAELARCVEASRATDPAPDRTALADLLRRASHMVVTHEDHIEALDLSCIVVAPEDRGAVVVDARMVLRDRS